MKVPVLKTSDFLTLLDITAEEMIKLFEFTSHLKKNAKKGKFKKYLETKTLAMIFEKSSTRTRVSFETGMLQLGGHALFLSSNDIQLGRGETIADTARVLARYNDGIMIRTFEHEKIMTLAHHASIPVINGLSDSFHPCQALADYYTIYEREKNLSGIKVTYIGDGNNVANSLLIGPKKYSPEMNILERAFRISSGTESNIMITDNIDEAVKGADYIYTDVWVSMGQEKETARKRKAFAKYSVTEKLLEKTGKDTKVLHCLPAHRGEEITDAVMDGPASIVFDQAENRLHCQKAVMCALMAKR
jgi:ornithine carbamoyltransferase